MSVYQNDEHMPYSDRVTVSVSQEVFVFFLRAIANSSEKYIEMNVQIGPFSNNQTHAGNDILVRSDYH